MDTFLIVFCLIITVYLEKVVLQYLELSGVCSAVFKGFYHWDELEDLSRDVFFHM